MQEPDIHHNNLSTPSLHRFPLTPRRGWCVRWKRDEKRRRMRERQWFKASGVEGDGVRPAGGQRTTRRELVLRLSHR